MARCLLLSLITTLAQGIAAASPAWLQSADAHGTAAGAAAAAKAPEKAPEPDTRSFIGAWAITDNLNNLFNVRLYPGGKAVSTVGTTGAPSAGATRLSASELRELGRWHSWGNGVRIDYSNGWRIWIDGSPAALIHASWRTGQSRLNKMPFNLVATVKLNLYAAQVFTVYSFQRAVAELKPYTATQYSNGLVFNDLDIKIGGA